MRWAFRQLGPKGRLYRTTDHLGSTRIVTDSSGNIALRRDYFPFGEEIPASSTFGNRNDFAAYNQNTAFNQQFTGQERDVESGLDYFLARYYAGPMGRFLSVDPNSAGAGVADPQTWNGYAYVNNNPVVFVDPTGEIATLPLAGIGAAVGAATGFVGSIAVQAIKGDEISFRDAGAAAVGGAVAGGLQG